MDLRGRLRSGIDVSTLLLAALVGTLGGLGGVAFREAADVTQKALVGGDDLLEAAQGMSWWARILLPTLGAAVASVLLYVIGREKETAGVADLMETVSLRKGPQLKSGVTILRSLASLGILSTGGSVGREGPILQIAASFGAGTGRVFRVSGQRLGLLLGCGVASGMAAAYNAPVAGAIFAMELILANFAIDVFAPVVLASVCATTVSRALLGGSPVYEIPAGLEVRNLPLEIPAFIVLGVAAGLAASLFMRSLLASEGLFRLWRAPPYVKTTVGGLLVGVLGVWVPHVWGNGYDVVDEILHDRLALGFVGALFFLKILATSITVGSGGPGGVFTPSLFVGAALGMVYGKTLGALLPDVVGPVATYEMVGMAGLIAGTTQAPIMAVFVLVEMTGDFAMVVPLMLGAIAASVVAHVLEGESLYTGKLKRRGVRIPEGIEELALASTRVQDVVRADTTCVAPGDSFESVLPTMLGSRRDAVYVVDPGRRLLGAIHLHDVKQFLADRELGAIVAAADLMRDVPTFTPDRTLAEALPTFDDPDLEEVPVVDGEQTRRLVGVVGRRDVIAAMAIEVLQSRALRAKFVTRGQEAADYVELPPGHRIQRVPVLASMRGHTIEQADFRRSTGLSILTVVREDEGSTARRLLPEPDLVLGAGDALIVLGPGERIDAYLAAPP
jgi:CIC family chloride channel protein